MRPSEQIFDATKVALVVTGPCGGGKTSAVEYLDDKHGIPGIPKYTDRPPRHDQSLAGGIGDARYICTSEFDRRAALPDAIVYRYGRNRYLLSQPEIRRIFDCNDTVSIISGHRLVAETLRRWVRVVSIYIDTRSDIIEQRLRRRGYTDEQLALRTGHSHQAEQQFDEDPTFYQHVIHNNSDRRSFEAELCRIAHHYNNLRQAAA